MIHPTALVSPEASLDESVEIGPYVIVEGPVKLAAGCRVMAHAQLIGDVEISENCSIGRGAIVGEEPQELSMKPGTSSGVRVGKETIIREYCTIHRSAGEGSMTTIGEGNYLMGGTHLGHDVQLGDQNIIANNCLLGGHVIVGEGAFLGGGAVFHQFIRLGDGCIVQGNSAISKDIPPFCIAARLNELHGLNVIGLRRTGADSGARAELKRAYQRVFSGDRPFGETIGSVDFSKWGGLSSRFFEFLRAESKKGVCFPKA